jgi:hypothetical protein
MAESHWLKVWKSESHSSESFQVCLKVFNHDWKSESLKVTWLKVLKFVWKFTNLTESQKPFKSFVSRSRYLQRESLHCRKIRLVYNTNLKPFSQNNAFYTTRRASKLGHGGCLERSSSCRLAHSWPWIGQIQQRARNESQDQLTALRSSFWSLSALCAITGPLRNNRICAASSSSSFLSLFWQSWTHVAQETKGGAWRPKEAQLSYLSSRLSCASGSPGGFQDGHSICAITRSSLVLSRPRSFFFILLTLLKTRNQRRHVESSGGTFYLFVVDVVEAPLRYSYTQDPEVAFHWYEGPTQPYSATKMVSSCFLDKVQYIHLL